MAAVPRETVTLSSGSELPLIGFGTWALRGPSAREAVGWALDAGYRHVDTATMYANENQVGAALADSRIGRDEVFITTKCPAENAGRELDTLRRSLDDLALDHVDLWLIHWPPRHPAQMWDAFIEVRELGLATAIGVSNFSLDQLDAITDATGTAPAVNQIRWSPLLFDPDVVEGHRRRGVVLEGYSGLKGGVLTNKVVREVGERLGRTPAQVVVRWHLQRAIVVIPKSAQRERIIANADVADFALSDGDMAALDGLGR